MDTITGVGDPSYNESMLEQRVARLEQDMTEVREVLGRLEPVIARMDERLNHMATREQLAEKPGKAYLWAVVGVMVAALVTTTFGAVALGVTVGREIPGLG